MRDEHDHGREGERHEHGGHVRPLTRAMPLPTRTVLTTKEAAELLANHIRVLFVPGQVIELRALDCRTGASRPHVEAGFFDTDHLVELATEALKLTSHAKGVYFTINPLQPDMISRRANRVDWANDGELAKTRTLSPGNGC